MNFPQELFDEILSYLPLKDREARQSLANCSLVSKSWTNPSRRHLFKAVNIREKSLQSWLDGISPANHELLQHIQALSYITCTRTWRSGWAPEYSVDVLQSYLPSLHRLQHLSLFSMQIPSDISPKLEIFSAFQHTLSRLSLTCCDVTISAFVKLINYFPNLDHLDLSYPRHRTDDKPAPPLSRPLIGRLHISEFRTDALGILDQLSELGPAFDEVIVDGHQPVRLPTLTHIASTVGRNTKHLRLLRTSMAYHRGAWSASLSPCQELREFEVVVTVPGDQEAEIISSTTSASIRKISLVHRNRGFSWRHVKWRTFDESLCRLVDNLGPTHQLEVEIRIVNAGVTTVSEDTDLGAIVNSFAAFMEKGRIKLVYVGRDKKEHIVYPLDPCSPNSLASLR